jgi:hypothetical protein
VKIGLFFSCLEAWIMRPYMSVGEAILNLTLFIVASYLPENWKILYLATKSYFNGTIIFYAFPLMLFLFLVDAFPVSG